MMSVLRVTAQDEVPYGPYPDQLIIFLQGGDATAVQKIETGEMQLYMWYLSTANTRRAEESELVDLVNSYGMYNELLINPLETTEGYNPFHLRAVREALNWLIDRNYIVNQLYSGRGVPKWFFYGSVDPDYARVADYMKQLESQYAYDFDKAKTAIFDALAEDGAVLQEGKWYYEGEPIVINLLIRNEDERKDVGDYLANQLEALGFTCNRMYKRSADAYGYWAALSPTLRGDWHVYTAGWISTAITAYSDDGPWFMYSPDNAPLFGEYNPSPLLREAMDKLNNGEYASAEERNELVKTISRLMLEDGCHIWILDQLASFPYASNLGSFVYDLDGGSQSFWTLRTVRYEQPGGTITVGARALLIEGFNPAAGFSWLYDVYSQYMVQEVGVYPHPHTGVYIPVRAGFTVQTAGPDGRLDVPADALTYNVATSEFTTVGSGVQSKSKITWDITLGSWHHGEAVNKADILAQIAEYFKLVDPSSDVYDPVAASPGRTVFVNNFRGVKFVSDNVVEIYLDYWHIDESFIASYADVFPAVPWELWALMNKVVAEKETAWSMDNADIWGVDMLDLTKGTSLQILANALTELSGENYVPPELVDYVTETEASTRWTALTDWYDGMGHFWVSAGPWIFDHVDTDASQLIFTAFREYPFKADAWDSMLNVKIPNVAVVSTPESVVPGLAATFNLQVSVAGAGYSDATMKYILVNPQGSIAGSGVATNVGGGAFSIQLTSTDTGMFSVGSYRLITITVGNEAAIPVTKEAVFTVTPALAYFQTVVQQIQSELGGRISTLENEVADLNTALASTQNALGMMNIALGLAAVSIIVALVAVVLSLRKR